MSYSLSLLDKSLIPEGANAAQAFQHTIALAQSAERLGYRRYWLAEHHGNRNYAGSAPEVLASHLLAKTSLIRIGTGGVMLQHYSPFKVAETFRVLASLAPGRVDLGIGKAPGGLPLTSKALQWLHDPVRRHEDFAVRLSELDAFLHDGVASGHALAGAVATPNPPQLPQRVLLGGSPESAVLAAQLGWEFVYAGHFNGDPVNLAQSVEAYRERAGRAPLLALFAFAAETHEEAARLVGALRSFRVHLPTGQTVNLPSLEAAAEFARQAGVSDYRTEERRPHVIAGTGEEVRDALDALSERFGIEEFVIDIPVADFAARHASVELLARARETVPA
ncbi:MULTISPECIES: LLM class flavin-dependent oxidoreductase [unclassified Variovorax]|uniref:LLM class flavin-dependent oxidoreductase n=1 Tax=unclassified Variovorax TaxID=663243 RepID=UPI000D1282AD|nr:MULTISPECIES: LLM class flavin-dependent oxidoreductase [unclassified Variovorax]AVQ80432.1 alkanal monooxygenase [Variovorax sp. PMC12]QRY30159.1 LLM class flavin-dependent oxidoreductase [Variovorax sp. PDNC026]